MFKPTRYKILCTIGVFILSTPVILGSCNVTRCIEGKQCAASYCYSLPKFLVMIVLPATVFYVIYSISQRKS